MTVVDEAIVVVPRPPLGMDLASRYYTSCRTLSMVEHHGSRGTGHLGSCRIWYQPQGACPSVGVEFL